MLCDHVRRFKERTGEHEFPVQGRGLALQKRDVSGPASLTIPAASQPRILYSARSGSTLARTFTSTGLTETALISTRRSRSVACGIETSTSRSDSGSSIGEGFL